MPCSSKVWRMASMAVMESKTRVDMLELEESLTLIRPPYAVCGHQNEFRVHVFEHVDQVVQILQTWAVCVTDVKMNLADPMLVFTSATHEQETPGMMDVVQESLEAPILVYDEGLAYWIKIVVHRQILAHARPAVKPLRNQQGSYRLFPRRGSLARNAMRARGSQQSREDASSQSGALSLGT